jgi:hypothetical protein
MTTTLFRTLDDVDVHNKRVLLRVDLNVPMDNGRVSDATRLERVTKTITELAEKGAKVILLSHFGRPKGVDPKQSLKPVAITLAYMLRRHVEFVDDCIGEKAQAATSSASKIHASIRAKRRTIPLSLPNSPSSATSGSTTRSRPLIAPTPRPKVSAMCCPPMPAVRCRPNSMR